MNILIFVFQYSLRAAICDNCRKKHKSIVKEGARWVQEENEESPSITDENRYGSAIYPVHDHLISDFLLSSDFPLTSIQFGNKPMVYLKDGTCSMHFYPKCLYALIMTFVMILISN